MPVLHVCMYVTEQSFRHLAVIWFGSMIDSFRRNHQLTSLVLPCSIDVTEWSGVGRGVWAWGGGCGPGVCRGEAVLTSIFSALVQFIFAAAAQVLPAVYVFIKETLYAYKLFKVMKGDVLTKSKNYIL